ncbi:MAG: hypothetical protein HC824_05235 [Synechococcales cyanobacterium RM1_1_8]|nr:hypothetical protein [Synechococcales cyanobacterium RM1_1_8]
MEADRDKLKQVILNVVANAIKFTDCGSITLELNLERRSQQPQRLILSVTDTGIGIDPGQQRQLFQPFARAGAAKNQYEGSGLGLAISRTLMERMGGEIHLISHGIGQGTTVKITLAPAAQPVDGAIAPAAGDHVPQPGAPPGPQRRQAPAGGGLAPVPTTATPAPGDSRNH